MKANEQTLRWNKTKGFYEEKILRAEVTETPKNLYQVLVSSL